MWTDSLPTVWGWGSLYSEVKDEQVWTFPGRGPRMVMSNISWVMVTWEPFPVDRQARLKTYLNQKKELNQTNRANFPIRETCSAFWDNAIYSIVSKSTAQDLKHILKPSHFLDRLTIILTPTLTPTPRPTWVKVLKIYWKPILYQHWYTIDRKIVQFWLVCKCVL